MSNEIDPNLRMAVFKGKQIRKIIHNDEWYFSITDIIDALTDSANSRRYWSDLKRKLIENEGFAQLYEKIVQLKMESSDGKKYQTDAANTETIFRIIQSIPSILNSHLKECARLIRLKDIPMIGLRNGCVVSRFEKR